MNDAEEANAATLHALHARTGSDPRWRRFGDISEMGVISGARWSSWLAEIGVTPKPVPGEFWTVDVVGGDRGLEEVAIVACPCGHEPIIRALAAPVKCEADGCQCERYFFFSGEDVFCFNTPGADGPTIVPQ